MNTAMVFYVTTETPQKGQTSQTKLNSEDELLVCLGCLKRKSIHEILQFCSKLDLDTTPYKYHICRGIWEFLDSLNLIFGT